AGFGRQHVRVDAQRRAAPVNVGVEVDQAGEHEPAAGVKESGCRFPGQVFVDGDDAPLGHTDVFDPYGSRCGIVDGTPVDEQIEFHDASFDAERRVVG